MGRPPGRLRFVCLCGLNHSLRDSERDSARRPGVQWPAQSVASLFPRAFVRETEMVALNRFFWNQFDAPAIAYYLMAAIVLVALISGIHTLVPA
jgi:Flp pilus assembly pilin Flp